MNENWNVDCVTDEVSNNRRCFAGTFTDNRRPFQVVYNGSYGPTIQVGTHNFPGRNPIVRFDNDDEPFTIDDDGGVSGSGTQMEVVSRMLTAEIARARWHVFPDGAMDGTVDVDGFDEAWARLQELI